MDIIEKYHGLSRIKDQFRILKSDLDTRPIHLSTREHITAHFTICFIAVVMIQLLQHRIKEYEGIRDDIENLQHGIPAQRIQCALNSLNVIQLPKQYYAFEKVKTNQLIEDLNRIKKAYNIPIKSKLYTAQELKLLRNEIYKYLCICIK